MANEKRGSDVNRHVVQTNYDKFENQNVVTARLVGRFLERVCGRAALLTVTGDSILDVGAGEGMMTAQLASRVPGREIVAIEYEAEGCAEFRSRYPDLRVVKGSAYNLPYPDDSFDLLTCFEVLEHLDDPEQALREMRRVARRHVVLTVPFEPFYRMGNMARGRYMTSLGNTPGHINHWGRSSLIALLSSYFPTAEVSSLFPWLLATASVRA